MTTTPKPDEFDPLPNLTPMVRQILDLRAQLAESEAAREALRAAAVRVLHGDKNSTARRDDGFPHCRTRRLGNLAMVVRSKRFAEEAYSELDDRDGILANALAADDKAKEKTFDHDA